MPKKDIYNIIDNSIWSSSSSNWWLYPINIQYKDLKLPIQKKYKYPKEVINWLKKFYTRHPNVKWALTHGWKHERKIKEELYVSFENKEVANKVVTLYQNLLKEDKWIEFNTTINKYRNVNNFRYEDWYILYDYIDTFGNLKQKKESVIPFVKYCKAKANPQEYLPKVDVRIVISNQIEDKIEIFKHHGFNGSCQKPENCTWHSIWYHDMYYNGWMCIIKMYIWEKFCWRSFARIMYWEDWQEYLLIDRIYSIWVLAWLGNWVYDLLHSTILNAWYKVLISYIRTNWSNVMFWEMESKSINQIFVGHWRYINDILPYTYYNNIYTQWLKTLDNIIFDMFNWYRNNIYLLSTKNDSNK